MSAFTRIQIMEAAERAIARALAMPSIDAALVIAIQEGLTIEEKTDLFKAVCELIPQATVAVSWPEVPGRRTTFDSQQDRGEKYEAAIARVREIHECIPCECAKCRGRREGNWGVPDEVCKECSIDDGASGAVVWPCRTIAALDAAEAGR